MKADRRYSTKIEDNSFSLIISNAKPDDQGKYKAIFKNKAGHIETIEALLTVTGKYLIIKSIFKFKKNFEILIQLDLQL
jgi:hypothetical protein